MVLWIMVTAQMAVWAWFSAKAGRLTDKQFLVFTAGMMTGQVGAGIETLQLEAWRAFIIQIFFLLFTAFGGVQRLRKMKTKGPGS